MSTEICNLAILAREDNSQIERLYNAVHRLIGTWAYKYGAKQETRIWEINDLIQSGFLALHDAIQTFNPDRGKFLTHFRFYIRKHFAEVSGYKSEALGHKKRPEQFAISLDERTGDDSVTLRIDLLTDPSADFEDDIIERESVLQDYAAIIKEVDKLPKTQRTALMLTSFDGLSQLEAAIRLGVTYQAVQSARDRAIKKLCQSQTVKAMSKQRANELYRHVPLSEYKSVGISAVELAVIKSEKTISH